VTVGWRVILAGGGTGGHLQPGVAVAEALVGMAPEVRVCFVGTGTPLERQILLAAGYRCHTVPARPLPRGIRQWPAFLRDTLAGYRRARLLLSQQRPAAVVGLGGYASVPVAWMAARRGVPVVLLEQNAVPGRATRWLSRSAAALCSAWDTDGWQPPGRVWHQVTGNPVQAAFFARGRPVDGQTDGPRQLLVLGGSQGARALNQTVPRLLARLRPLLANWRIVHQSGWADWQATRTLYARLGLEATVVPFVADMPALLTRSALAVSRAGGTTLAELAATAVPAVLVPYPFASDDHQRINARRLVSSGAAVTVDQDERYGPFAQRLQQAVERLLADSGRLARMRLAMGRLARPEAAMDVARVVLHLADRSGRTGQQGLRPHPPRSGARCQRPAGKETNRAHVEMARASNGQPSPAVTAAGCGSRRPH